MADGPHPLFQDKDREGVCPWGPGHSVLSPGPGRFPKSSKERGKDLMLAVRPHPGGMVQLVEAVGAKADHLIWIPGTHMVIPTLFSSLHTHSGTRVPMHTYAQNSKIKIQESLTLMGEGTGSEK